MRELQYPFDAEMLMSKKRRIKKELLTGKQNFIKKNIAILGGSTTNDIKNMMELFLLDNGILPSFYESDYNQYYEDALFSNFQLDEFHPDVIYICTSVRNIIRFPQLSDSTEEVTSLLNEEKAKFLAIWDSLQKRFDCSIVQNNFDLPPYRLLGNYDVVDRHGATNFILKLNLFFAEQAAERNNLYVCDINYISADFGLQKWHDAVAWYMYKYAMSLSAIPYLAFNVANIIKALYGKNKKGFVLDLDNTLWGGVIGDDGAEHIVLGQEMPEGQAYTDFQQYIKSHKQLGILLNIDSKNDYENAILGLKHPDSKLSEDDFIEIKANWEPKDRNLADIAEALHLLPESLVFIDDNPAERLIVSESLPGVTAPEIGKITDYIRIIDRNGFFETVTISQDDLKRNEMYRENANRTKLELSYSDYGEYLIALKMKATIAPFDSIHMARIAQLTNKSNQFNLTTRRYTQAELEEITVSSDFITLYGRLEDRFGDNGVVAVIIGHVVEDTCYIDLWLMSCRVLKRDMECAMLDRLVKMCQERNVCKLQGSYIPTAKNKMVANFYSERGFELLLQEADGVTVWQLDISNNYIDQNKHIMIGD